MKDEKMEMLSSGMPGNKLGNKSGFIEINTKRNDRKWNRNFFKLRMLLVVYNIINGTI